MKKSRKKLYHCNNCGKDRSGNRVKRSHAGEFCNVCNKDKEYTYRVRFLRYV